MILGLLLFTPVRLSFEAHAEPVRTVVERLSRETQTPLFCANDVGLRRVFAFVEDADPIEFRSRLAKAVGAEWVETPKGLRLEVAPKTRSADMKRHRETRIAWITRTIDEFQRVEPGAWDASTARKLLQDYQTSRQKARERGYLAGENVAVEPAVRAGCRALYAIGAAALADLEWNEKRVWSTRTRGRFVSGLPETMRQAVRAFNRESEALQSVFTTNPDLAKNLDFSFVLGPRRSPTDPLLAEAADITVEVSRKAFSPDLSLAVYLSAANGTIVDSAWLSLSHLWSIRSNLEGPVGDLAKELPHIPVTLSPAARDWFTTRDLRHFSPPSAVNDVRRYPDRYEPLGLLYSDAFRAVAKRKGLNIVAQVGDLDLGGYTDVKNAALLRNLFTEKADNVQLDEKWLVIGTKDPIETDRSRLDRSVLGTYVRALVADQFESMNAFLPVLRASGGLTPHPVVTAAALGFKLERLSGAGMPDANALNLLDRFPAANTHKAFAALALPQREALQRYVYGPGGGHFRGLDPASALSPPHIDRIPHIAFPNGLPGDLIFDLKVEEEDIAFRTPPPNAPMWTDHSPRPPVHLAISPDPSVDGEAPKYRVGKVANYSFTIEVPGRVKNSGWMSAYWTDLSRPAVGFSQLPEWFRQKVDAVRKGN